VFPDENMIILFAILSAILGRLGGSRKGLTKYRDLGIPALFVGYQWLTGHSIGFPYILTSLLMFGALTTYWDKLFGYDNFWFAGSMVALSLFPVQVWWVVVIKTILLGIIWELVQLYMPKLWFKGNGVTKELVRYGVTFLVLV
jgi:hypothetical protein